MKGGRIMTPEKAELSPTERKVLKHLAQGRTAKEIAKMLDLKFSTIDTFIRRIYAKLDVHNRAAAVAWYCRNNP